MNNITVRKSPWMRICLLTAVALCFLMAFHLMKRNYGSLSKIMDRFGQLEHYCAEHALSNTEMDDHAVRLVVHHACENLDAGDLRALGQLCFTAYRFCALNPVPRWTVKGKPFLDEIVVLPELRLGGSKVFPSLHKKAKFFRVAASTIGCSYLAKRGHFPLHCEEALFIYFGY